jgi:hypothetical protein
MINYRTLNINGLAAFGQGRRLVNRSKCAKNMDNVTFASEKLAHQNYC